MKAMHEISTPQDIVLHRARLLQELNKQEKTLGKDADRIRKSWNSVSYIVSTASTGLNWFWMGFSVIKWLLRRKK